jgi:hypothetical protein
MTSDGKSYPRPPCESLPKENLGPYETFGALEACQGASAIIARTRDTEDDICILRPRPADQDPQLSQELMACRAHGSRYTNCTLEPIEGQTYSRSHAFVSEPLSSLLAHGFEQVTPLPLSVSLSISYGILNRLQAQESSGPHGDLVPHHVLVGFDGSIELIDRAGTKHGKTQAKKPSRMSYRSPEHVSDDAIELASDIFMAGVFLYEMTTGEPMFADTGGLIDHQIRSGRYRRPRSLVGRSYPIELQVVLRKMLNTERTQRFEKARDAIDGLDLVNGPNKKQQARLIQAYMHKTFPVHYTGWRTTFQNAGVELPPPEVTHPDASIAAVSSNLLSVRTPASRSDTRASAQPPEASPEYALPMPEDPPLEIIEEPTHVEPLGPVLAKLDAEKPRNRLPPLSANSQTSEREEITNPHAMADTENPNQEITGDFSEHIVPAEPTPTPATPELDPGMVDKIAEALDMEKIAPDRSDTNDVLDEIIPRMDADFRSATMADNGFIADADSPHIAVAAQLDDAHNLQSLVDTTDLSLDHDDMPLDQADIDHLLLAADLLTKAPESTDRNELEGIVPNPFSDDLSLPPPATTGKAALPSFKNADDEAKNDSDILFVDDAHTGEGLAIPKARKITPRSQSDWSQPAITTDPSGRPGLTAAPARPRPLERLTRDSIIQAHPEEHVQEELSAPKPEPSQSARRHQPTQVVRDRIVPNIENPPAAFVPESNENDFNDELVLSEALVLPISDTTLNKEYLRQKKLVRVGSGGVVVLLLVIAILIYEIMNERSTVSSQNRQPYTAPTIANPKPPSKNIVAQPPKTIVQGIATSTAGVAPQNKPVLTPIVTTTKESLPAVESQMIVIQAFPIKKARIYVDNKEIENGTAIEISDKDVQLVIKARGYRTYRETIKTGRTEPIEVLLNRAR